jgi:uncharacterized protein with GYD domain
MRRRDRGPILVSLKVGSLGNLRTVTLRALSVNEMRAAIAKAS